MKRSLAFVLGGGGARGALQVGALRALLEAGYRPDLLVGTSIGAMNAAFLALHGLNSNGIAELERAWLDAISAELLPQNYLWLTLRALFRRPDAFPFQTLRNFILSHGLPADLRFRDLTAARLVVVSANLNGACTTLHGLDRDELVLEALLASTALPPWMAPVELDDKLLMDGGVVSNLPIEPALRVGATEIIALALSDPGDIPPDRFGVGSFFARLLNTIDCRQAELELALARARHVPVSYVHLQSDTPAPVWDFRRTLQLIPHGYDQTKEAIAGWQVERPSGLMGWLRARLRQ
jgi:NTE family protein